MVCPNSRARNPVVAASKPIWRDEFASRSESCLNGSPLGKISQDVILQDQILRYSGLLRLTGKTSRQRGKEIELIVTSREITTRRKMTSLYN